MEAGQEDAMTFRADGPDYRKLTTGLYPRGGLGAVAFDLVLVKE